jgi:3-hydroxy-3-methylglutaryl CoA synthase
LLDANINIEDKTFEIAFDVNIIYTKIFQNRNDFLKTCEEFVLENDNDFDKNENYFNEIRDIIEKYDREYGLSVNDFIKLRDALKFFNIN